MSEIQITEPTEPSKEETHGVNVATEHIQSSPETELSFEILT